MAPVAVVAVLVYLAEVQMASLAQTDRGYRRREAVVSVDPVAAMEHPVLAALLTVWADLVVATAVALHQVRLVTHLAVSRAGVQCVSSGVMVVRSQARRLQTYKNIL
jgi:hypothetical protein